MKRWPLAIAHLIYATVSCGEETDKPGDGHFFGNLVCSSRSLKGVIVSKTTNNSGGYGA